jgi:hypothetical protein
MPRAICASIEISGGALVLTVPDAGDQPATERLPVPLEAEGLLLEGARRVDEWSQIQKKIPSFDLVYRRSKDKSGAAAGELTYPQQRIMPLLDGTRDVNGLVDATGLGEFDVGKALYGLVTAGIAQLVDRRSSIRHLDYRELLAYLVREAEFADAQRRKEAGRHIVDCPTCSSRLRTIQVRRTEASGTFVPATLDMEQFAEQAPARPQLQPLRPPTRHPGIEVVRLSERRVGRERTAVARSTRRGRSGTRSAASGCAAPATGPAAGAAVGAGTSSGGAPPRARRGLGFPGSG